MTSQWIVAEAARLLEKKGAKAKTVTSCDNAFVTSILLARRPRRSGKGIKAKGATSCGNAFMTNILLA